METLYTYGDGHFINSDAWEREYANDPYWIGYDVCRFKARTADITSDEALQAILEEAYKNSK